MIVELFCNLLFAHVIGDFYLQCDKQCENKTEKGINGYGLWYHTLVIGILSWLVVWQTEAWWLVLCIMASHFAIDWCKSYASRRVDEHKYGLSLFVIDQALHVAILYGISWVWCQYNQWEQFGFITQYCLHHPLRVAMVLAMLLALKPANILILNVLDACKVSTQSDYIDEGHGNFHSGELIGWLERGLMLVFVVMGQYEAIGFLIAGKSILRFGDINGEDEKSEYVLTGTFLSLAVALALGLIAKTLAVGGIRG